MKFIVSPSIISADFTNIKEEIKKVEYFQDSFLHLDIMDGNFVPNITFGPFIGEQLRNITNIPFDTHLMINHPEKFIERFAVFSDYITFHIEETTFPFRLVNTVKGLNKKCGVSLNPSTPIEHVFDLLPYVDLLLIMSVEPGFSGQKFIKETLLKIEKAYEFRKKNGLTFLISVDGGINEETIQLVLEKGVDVLVMGNFFFKNDFNFVKSVINKYRK
ncbi:ribulose-phosphate 3-epimerase [Caldisericum exile]|uniref:Ribulose-phosphate 3-epimerase n=1 Tax=Caldisericum exile (strain DSM 21853 / NBRC 104410 / AZM16c01) TaxID=511051 RepID=A0A7U6GEV9_CALEA|nr:ribulose-phosphate 3-epimerase [Caldisericum exile]BAL81122.1 ribulose-5-phosphate 3-epimerase [Caldisericum exile AZM16c01]